MSPLRVLRNLAVLVILTVAQFGLASPSVSAQTTCGPVGAVCSVNAQCCFRCGVLHRCCAHLFGGNQCKTNYDCCSGKCLPSRVPNIGFCY